MFSFTRNTLLRQARSQLLLNARHPASTSPPYARLASTLAILEQKDGKILPACQQVVAAAKAFGGPVVGIIAGKDVKSAADEAAKIEGLDKVIAIDNADYEKVCRL